ncbi:hypothetical protein SODALDRAFT_185845 [Sodiomyces alkalinus F11]|uniref:Carrier domain-containing protein n=1 Tax=Sodiomyces alkalinus (strain CBS 110278 / VKM F-3762 / F11) TaxID=1314773 RepID=A0A3N2PUW1_SODAK|nr:hypothetical protein SODALDRAFT_185845 [Sodiomyces alkalinus F11]ROT38291.1 hypothetical protein SODALDRAFT_185845 [Sodiomyces alkalinus F11]
MAESPILRPFLPEGAPDHPDPPEAPLDDQQQQQQQQQPTAEMLDEERLLSAIADILAIPKDSVDLLDSFTHLGGNKESARALSSKCASMGLRLKTTDILRCQTITELQTRLVPIASKEPDSDHSNNDPSDAPADPIPDPPRPSGDDPAHSPDPESQPHRPPSHTFADREAVENLILSTPQVSGAALIRPKAGWLEDKLVAFISLSNPNVSSYSLSNVHVISQSQMHYAGSQVAAIRLALEQSDRQLATPNNWIVLDQMPTNQQGEVDRRKLQTWAQNMNEDMYRQVTSLEFHERFQEPLTDMERTIQKAVSRVLRLPESQVGMNFSFAQLGGDEVSTMLLVAACRTQGVSLRPEDVLNSPKLSQVASLASHKGDSVSRWNEESLECFKLSPIQQLYFDTPTGSRTDERRKADGNYRFNQSVLLRVTRSATLEDIHAAVRTTVGHHSMLRSRFNLGPDGWTQRILPDVQGSFGFGYHDVTGYDEVLKVMEQTQARIDIEHGPVFAVDQFHMYDGQQMVFLVAHQLVIDRLSWRILIHDLDELLREGILFSQRSMPFQTWNELQEKDFERTSDDATIPFSLRSCDSDSWGLKDSLNTYNEAAETGFRISSELTSILHTTCNQVFRTESADIYLTALLLSFIQTFPNRPPPTIWNQEHGRELWSPEIDIAETVGWFTSLCPIGLRSEEPYNLDCLHMLRDLKDTRRSTSHRGWKYFASRCFGPYAETRCSEAWPFEILFTYAGSSKQLERENGALQQMEMPVRALGSAFSDHGPSVSRMALFEVSVTVDHGCANVHVLYNRHSRYQDKIADWIHTYEHVLYEAIGKLRYRAQELTLADVPLLNTTYEGLAKLNTDRLLALGLTSARDIEDVLPVTASQQCILISQIQSLDVGHNTCIYELSVLNGVRADQALLCTVWEQIVTRYPALRTVFIDSITEDGLFDQVILRRCSPTMLFFDAATGDDPITALRALPPMPANPAQPRHRLSVCDSPTGTYLRLEASQALCDMPSLQLLMADLKRIYNSGKTPMSLLDPSHTACMHYLYSARREGSLAFWHGRLREVHPCYFPRLLTTNEKHTRETYYSIDITASQMDEFCRQYATSRATVMRLAWALVVRAFTGSNRVCFGYRTPGRDGKGAPHGLHQSIGCFENTIPCFMDLWAYQSIEAVVRDAEEDFRACLQHQHVSTAEIEHALGLKDEELFNTCMTYVEDPPELKSRFTSTRPQLSLSCAESFSTFAYDISFLTMFVNGQLACGISHRILSLTQAWSVTRAFGQALRSILNNPTTSVGGLDLSVEENGALVRSTKIELLEPCVHSLFSNRARASPDAQAVCAADGDFSYKTLTRLVQRLATHIVQRGVRPGVAVPVILGKTRWSIVSMLAVMKAGGCFVPVDGDDRNMAEAVIRQIAPPVILATDMINPNLHLPEDGVLVINEALFSTQIPSDAPMRKASENDAACILFPAGSGRSKELRGFVYSHNALSTAFLAQGGPLRIDQDSRVLQVSSFSLDISLFETLATLVHGGCVCIPSAEERKRDIEGAIRRMEVTWTYITPILARRLQPESLPSLKVTCFRTRGLDEDTCAPWLRSTKVLLAYGCLEICPLGISVLEVAKPEDLQRLAQPFLGKLWIANPEDSSKLVPTGAIGELCIESPTLAQKFVPGQALMALSQQLAVASQDGPQLVRYIKTSQRVRDMEDGTMELLPSSRQDITIDGKVVAASKVEQHLRRCLGQGVDVAVESISFEGSTQLLAAFIQLDKLFDGPEEVTNLSVTTRKRAYLAKNFAETSLRNTLPAHMIPSVFIPVRRLPLTTAMKVHRRKLQKMVRGISREALSAISDAPSPDHARDSRVKPLPLTQVEERMRSIWAKFLEVDEATIDGNQTFRKLGGSGYLAARVAVACRKEGLTVSIQDVLGGASLTGLCQGITLATPEPAVDPKTKAPATTAQESPTRKEAEGLVPESFIEEVVLPRLKVERDAIKDVAEATAPQIRSLELALLKDRGDISYLTFSFSGIESSKKLEAACLGLCVMHPILQTAFVVHERKVYQIALRLFKPEFRKIQCPSWRLSHLADRLIKKDQTEPITLGTPVTRFFYLESGKQSTLIMRLSKAQYDDASVAILIQDLKKIYAGAQSQAPRPTFLDLVRSAQLAHHRGARTYWASLLDGARMTQVIAHSKPASTSSSVKTIRQTLAITSLASLGISLDTVVKSAWAMVLAKLSASADVLFGEIIEGRHIQLAEGANASGVLGPAKNTIPVRVRFGHSYTTPMDLMSVVHGQRVTGIQFENMGWLDMVQDCTALPYWTRFSTAVHHQSHDSSLPTSSFKLGSASCKLNIQESAVQDVFDVLVRSRKPQPDTAEMSLTFCEHRVPTPFAIETLKMLCSNIELLTSVSMMHPLVPSGSEFSAMTKQIPLSQPEVETAQAQLGAHNIPTEHYYAIQALIAAAWTQVLDPRSLGVPESQLHNAAFYDLWGSMIPASQLAQYMNRELPNTGVPGLEEVTVTMEEVVAHPTMMAQLELMARKMMGDREERTRKRLPGFGPRTSSLSKGLKRLSSVIKDKGPGRTGSGRSSPECVPTNRTPFSQHRVPPVHSDGNGKTATQNNNTSAQSTPSHSPPQPQLEQQQQQQQQQQGGIPAPTPAPPIMVPPPVGPAMEPIVEKDGEQVVPEVDGETLLRRRRGKDTPPLLALNLDYMEGDVWGGLDGMGSATSHSENEDDDDDDDDDLVLPLQGPRREKEEEQEGGEGEGRRKEQQQEKQQSEAADLVSPLSPVSKRGYSFIKMTGIGETEAAGSAGGAKESSSMRRKASSIFERMGRSSPVSVSTN